MEVKFSIRDALGNVLRVGESMAVDFAGQVNAPGEVVVEGRANQTLQWINPVTNEIEDKKLMPVNVLEEQMPGVGVRVTLTGLSPTGQVMVNDEDTFLMDGETSVQFTFSTTGLYVLYCTAPEYLAHRVFVDVN